MSNPPIVRPRGARELAPSIAGWTSYPRAFLNLLAFGLVAVGGEWAVHQLEYLTEYGPRFGTVMATTPHRVYQMPLGLASAAGILGVLVLVFVTLLAARETRRRFMRRIPVRAARHVPDITLSLPMKAVAATASALLLFQTAIYVVQENLEGFAVTSQWRGFSVVLGAQHATVLPYGLVVATLGALLLWTLGALMHGSRCATQMVRTLAAILKRRPKQPALCTTLPDRLPDLRLATGSLSLRSPPRAA